MKAILMSVLCMVSATAMAASSDYKVDASASKVEWLGKKVTGEHSGTIGVKGGSITLDGKKVVGGTVLIDMTSIKNVDITDAEYNKKLIDHLQSDDFFSTSKFNQATFVIKSAKERTPGELELQGDLTIKGVTHPATFPAQVKLDGKIVSASGKLVVDRTKYGIRYGSGKFFQNLGDKMINDEFELTFSLNAKK